MKHRPASWILLTAAAIGGCGGSLSGGTGGTGGGATAGASGTAATTGTAGTAGTGGTIGGSGSGDAGAGGSPYEGTTTWGDVTVQVAATNLGSGNLTMYVVDPTIPDLRRTFTYPSATRFSPDNDGAYVVVRYTCGGPTVDQVALLSCASGGIAGGTLTPGCIGVTFDQRGPMGNFVDTDGTSCGVTVGSASFHVPPPGFAAPPTDASTPDAASGSFNLDCVRPDGTHLNLNARFVIPIQSALLIC